MPWTTRCSWEFCHLFPPGPKVSQLPITVFQNTIHIAFAVTNLERVGRIEDCKLLVERQ